MDECGQICVGIGACEEEDFFFQSEPEHYTQDQWDDHCFVCQAFADDLEVNSYNSIVTDGDSQQSCTCLSRREFSSRVMSQREVL